MIESTLIVLWTLSAFAWSTLDIKNRINNHGIRWYYVPLFMFNMIFMPLLAAVEKYLDDMFDYTDIFKD